MCTLWDIRVLFLQGFSESDRKHSSPWHRGMRSRRVPPSRHCSSLLCHVQPYVQCCVDNTTPDIERKRDQQWLTSCTSNIYMQFIFNLHKYSSDLKWYSFMQQWFILKSQNIYIIIKNIPIRVQYVLKHL